MYNIDNIQLLLNQVGSSNIYTDQILKINDIKIPNFYLLQMNHVFINHNINYWEYEFCHLIEKIYFTNIQNNISFYETNNFQISSNDIIFDCGGNMGLFAAYAATKGKKVYSFEPMSLIRKNLLYTASLYNNIIVVPKGVSNKCEIVKFAQTDNPGASCDIIYQNQLTNKILYYEYCELITLDDFITITNIKPTFIKADIEYSENNMLLGLKNYLINYNPKLSIVFHKNINKQQIQKQLFNYYLEFKDTNEGILLLGEKK